MPHVHESPPMVGRPVGKRTPCPACGGLQCLCRPRFFAGQLLTEEDLNRLERYVIEKNRLHNRYLVGWGVACGLEVHCNPCPGYVTVGTGYAVSPCGDDIVVCTEAPLDVCQLIAACQDKRQWECEPPWANDPAGCEDAIERWQLAICYDEKPSRGVTALRGSAAPTCCSTCRCGGSAACGCGAGAGCDCGRAAGCGCGCHAAATAKANGNGGYKPRIPSPPPVCEPTITCEGYRFVVWRVPALRGEEPRSRGQLIDRALACLAPLLECWSNPPAETKAEIQTWCCRLRECLLEFLATHPSHECSVGTQIAGLCGDPDRFQSAAAYRADVLGRVFPILLVLVRDCLCASLLPPCPEPAVADCVPLAQLEVRRRNCQIVRICNFEGRRFLVSMPNLAYWLSPLAPSVLTSLQQQLARLCCSPVEFPVPPPPEPEPPPIP